MLFETYIVHYISLQKRCHGLVLIVNCVLPRHIHLVLPH